MELYLIENRQGPLDVLAFPSNKKVIESFVKKFPKRLEASYRKINSEKATEIKKQIIENLAIILIDKYNLATKLYTD